MTIGRMLEKEAKLARSSMEELWLRAQEGHRGEPLLLPYAPSGVGGPKSK